MVTQLETHDGSCSVSPNKVAIRCIVAEYRHMVSVVLYGRHSYHASSIGHPWSGCQYRLQRTEFSNGVGLLQEKADLWPFQDVLEVENPCWMLRDG